MSADPVPFDKAGASSKPCPICGKPADQDVVPFCSKRCADVDLHRWLGGVYVVPDDDLAQQPGEPSEDET